MGGNAFPNVETIRIKCEDVLPTVKYVVDALQIEHFTYDYATSNMMGSAGKQADSGDIDFALNNYQSRLIGEPDLPVFQLRDFAARAREILPEGHVHTKTMRGGQIQTAFPICGDPSRGWVQVDFISGKPEWLLFSHFSPGAFVSPYKGVMISTMLGVLAKMRKDFEVLVGVQRVARIGLRYDLEKGVYRSWQYTRRPGHGMTTGSADEFETAFECPWFSRLHSVTDPEYVLELLFGFPVKPHEVNTFEKMVVAIKKYMPDRFQEAKERFLVSSKTSSAANSIDLEQLAMDPVWDL